MPDDLRPIGDVFAQMRTPQGQDMPAAGTDTAPIPAGQPEQPELQPISQVFAKSRSLPSAGEGMSDAMGANPPGMDEWLSQGPVGKILDAFGQGAKQGWGTDHGLSDDVTDALKKAGIYGDVSKGQATILQAFNEGLIRPVAASLDLALRAGGAGLGGVEAAAAEAGAQTGTETGRLAGQAVAGMIEAGQTGQFHGLRVAPPHFETAKDMGAIGVPEDVYMGTKEAPEGTVVAQAPLARPEAPTAEIAPEAPPVTPPSIDTVARQIDPDTFKTFDALTQEKATYMRWLGDLKETRDQTATADLDKQIAEQQAKLEDATGKRAATYRNRVADLTEQRAQALADVQQGDTPDMAKVRQSLMQADYKMRDLAPTVGEAYRQAREQIGPEPEPEIPAPVEQPAAPVQEPTPEAAPVAEPEAMRAVPDSAFNGDVLNALENVIYGEHYDGAPVPLPNVGMRPEEIDALEKAGLATDGKMSADQFASYAAERERRTAPKPRAAQLGPEAPPTRTPVADIAQDVSQKLVSAGRPAEEADAAGQLIAAHYDARAANLGTESTKLYADEAPGVEGATRGRKGELGRTIVKDSQTTIRLMKNADASTFIHETGHNWLEEMMRDAQDDRAVQSVKDDAQTVRGWLGVGEGEAIPTRAHEKFARGFERYMMEGRAPTQALAGVFAKFKSWLTQIYQTVSKLRSPISDDIRQVFDRMLAAPEKEPIIGREEEPKGNFADQHETLAETTPPEKARAVADQIRTEADAEAAKEPAVNARLTGRPSEARGDEAAGAEPGGAGPERGPEPPAGGTGPESGEVGPGGNQAAPEGNVLTLERTEFKPGATTKDLAGNIRLENLNMEEDARAIVRQIAAANTDLSDARFGEPAYQLMRQVHAAGQLLELTAKAAVDALEKWKQSGSENDALAYTLATDRVLLAANVRAELAAGTGRGLAAFRKISRPGPTEDVVAYIQRTTGKTLFQLREEGDLLNGLDTAAQQAKFLNESRSTFWQKFRAGYLSLFINNLISGPLTHAAYSIGNTTWGLFKAVAITPTAATFDAVHEMMAGHPLENRVYAAEAVAQLHGLVRGWRDALPSAVQAIKTGVPFMKGMEEMAARAGEPAPEYGVREQGIPGKVGYILETPSRSVSAIHTIFYAGNYEAEIARRAVRSAIKDGLTGEDYNTRVAERTAKPLDQDVIEAHDEALKMVLMKRPPYDSSMAALSRFVNNNLAAKTVMPFLQIGTNILKGGLVEMTPVGLISKDVRENLSGANGAIARSTQYAKIAVGTSAAVATIGLAAEGLITGGGPPPTAQGMAKRRLMEAGGWKAYSIHIGDGYIPYRKYLGPLGPLIAGAADMYEVGHAAGQEGFGAAASAAIFGFSEVVADETWMSGLSSFINAARNWDTQGEKYLRNLATDFIPFSVGMAQTARLIDPYQRVVNSFTDSVKNHIPGLSETLLPQRDVWGNPIASHTMLSPTTDQHDPVTEALLQLDWAPTAPQKTINGVRLTPEQYDDYSRIAGRMAHAQLDAVVRTPGFTAQIASNPSLALRTVQEIVKKARETARSMVKMQSWGGPNDIASQATKNKLAKLGATTQ